MQNGDCTENDRLWQRPVVSSPTCFARQLVDKRESREKRACKTALKYSLKPAKKNKSHVAMRSFNFVVVVWFFFAIKKRSFDFHVRACILKAN